MPEDRNAPGIDEMRVPGQAGVALTIVSREVKQPARRGKVKWVVLHYEVYCVRVKPPIKDTPKEDKPPNKGQAESTHVHTLCRKSPLKKDNL